MKKTLLIVSLLIAIPSFVFAQEARLSVRDDGGATTFAVQENGAITTNGEDSRNNFQLKIIGHVGGESHAQLVTDDTNSRLTLMASTADDNAPRLFMFGPEDSNNKGWLLFDYGSNTVDLPEAQFRLRHWQPGSGNSVDLIRTYGRDAVTFPDSAVMVGIRTINPQYPLQVTTGGAYCNGNQWVDKSSRKSKENIAELNREEAFATLRKMTPVKYSYKDDAHKETNVGFIAEDVPELVATQDRKGLVSMEVVAILTKVVQEQQETIAALTKRVNNLEER